MKTSPPKPLADGGLFDDSGGYERDTGFQPASRLSDQEKRQAATLYRIFNELWGVCIVHGDPGSGKDTFGNWLSFTLKRYFPRKKIWRDERPRHLYGPYAGLFDEEFLCDDLKRMREAAKGVGATKVDEAMEKAADEWVGSKGKVLLQDSVLYLTEYWRYCYNREPHNPMNKTMGGIHKMKRHLNCLIIGTVQLPSELDKKTCLPWVDWRVTCSRSRTDSTRYTFFVERIKYDRRLDILVPEGRPFAIPLDAGKPRSFMGDGKIIVRRPDYLPENEEERVVLSALKAGVDNYEELVELLGTEGDMLEHEVLDTLKRLTLRLPGERPKFVTWYPCVYFLFNSRSPPQIRTSLRVGKEG